MGIMGVAFMFSVPAWAIDCSDIKPAAPQTSDASAAGKLEASVDGFFKQLISPRAESEGNYRKVVSDVLPDYPNADRIFVWQRVLFLECQLLNEDKTLTTKDRLDQFNKLATLYYQPPPPPVASAATNSLTNSGNNSNVIQGSGNSISTGKP
jgi:hypothetical protein